MIYYRKSEFDDGFEVSDDNSSPAFVLVEYHNNPATRRLVLSDFSPLAKNGWLPLPADNPYNSIFAEMTIGAFAGADDQIHYWRDGCCPDCGKQSLSSISANCCPTCGANCNLQESCGEGCRNELLSFCKGGIDEHEHAVYCGCACQSK